MKANRHTEEDWGTRQDNKDGVGVKSCTVSDDTQAAQSKGRFPQLAAGIEEETKEAGAELCLDAFKTKLDELIRALRFRDGQSAVMLGHNGVGKTTIINLLHHITLMGAEEYRAVLEGYVPEALQLLFDSDSDSPTLDISLSSLMSTNAETRKWLQTNGVDVDPAPPLSDPDGAAASRRAEGLAHEAEQSIRAYCEGDPKPPKIDHGVLPSGEPGGTTTSLITYEHYGRIVHLLVVLKTLAEVKEKMQEFVTLWKVADGTTVGMSGEEREALFRAWSYYYALAHGHEYDGLLTGRFERDLPKCEDLPKSKDAIQVCQSVLQLLKTRYLLFLGRGESIHLDCAMVRQQLLELNAGKSEMQVLRRMVVEKVEVCNSCIRMCPHAASLSTRDSIERIFSLLYRKTWKHSITYCATDKAMITLTDDFY
eukprot:4141805-Pleurochrysis_carterae.AAC.3